MTGILILLDMNVILLILLDMNVILWKILVKLMFAKKLAGQNFLPCPALCPAPAALRGKQGRAKK